MPAENERKEAKSFSHSILEHRDKLSTLRPVVKPASVPYKDILIPLRAEVEIPVRIYRPEGSGELAATLFFVPGTAFVAREIAFTEIICSHLAEKSKCQVIVINHRLAPEDKFPKGLSDAYQLLRFIIQAPPTLFKIDKSKICIIGYSSGGNFAASMAVEAAKEGLPITRQILFSPLVDLSRSLRDFKEKFEDKDTVISDAFVEWFINLYVPDRVSSKNPLVSPFFHEASRLRKLPPTDIIVGEYDRFRSDAEAYFNKLESTGVNAKKWVIEKENHSYLWYKLTVLEAIGKRVKIAFGLEPIPDNHLIFIKPEKTLLLEEKQAESSSSVRSKL